MVPACAVRDPGAAEVRGNTDGLCSGLIQKLFGGVGSELVGMHVKGRLAGVSTLLYQGIC